MNARQLRLLLQQLLQAIEAVNASGEEMSDDFQGQIAQTLGSLYGRLRQAQTNEASQERQGEPNTLPGAPSNGPSNDAQLLWILAGQQPQAFISYLRTFPTPATQNILSDPSLLNSTITQLNEMMPPGQPPVINGIQHADLNSSNVWGAAYDQKTGKMQVRFQGGSEYEYDGVPANIFNAFIKGNASARTQGRNQYGRWWRGKNPSLGAALNQYIKAGNFPYRRVR